MITSELKTTTTKFELYRAEEYNKVVCDVAVRTILSPGKQKLYLSRHPDKTKQLDGGSKPASGER